MTDDAQLDAPRRSPVVPWVTLAVGSLAILIAILFRPKPPLDDPAKHAGVGVRLPQLELQPLTGVRESVSLETIRGKVALINYWGTWCGPCIVEFPYLLELWDQYRQNPDFVFLSVSSTFADREPVDAVRSETAKFLRSRNATMPTYIDAEGTSRQALAMIMGSRALAYPTTVLLDRDGIVRAIWVGYTDGSERQMEQLVSQLLAEKS